VEAQLFQALLEDVLAGHSWGMIFVDDVVCDFGEVNADVNSGEGPTGVTPHTGEARQNVLNITTTLEVR